MSAEAIDIVMLCGGRGTRLGALTAQTPKPLLPIAGIPFLFHRLMALKQEGPARFLLAVHYLADQFQAFARDYAEQLPNLTIIEEAEPLGTGGALRHAAQQVTSPLFVAMNGDSWVDQPLAPVVAAHRADRRALTMVLVRADRVEGGARPRGIVSVDTQERLTGFRTTDAPVQGWVNPHTQRTSVPTPPGMHTPAGGRDAEPTAPLGVGVNAGVYVFDTAMVRGWPAGTYSFEEHVLSLVPPGTGAAFYSDGKLLDIGTPACYAQAQGSGLVGAIAS